MPEASLHPFKELIGQRCGLTFDDTGEVNLKSALQRRIKIAEAKSLPNYLARIIADEAEFHELVALLTVNETYFYREPAQLTLLAERLVPRLLAKLAGSRPLRVFSAGCSTGEEPYSIAIALREQLGESARHLVSIVAADIDLQALAKARHAEYGDFSFRGLSPALRARYFTCQDTGTYVLHPDVRSAVEFRHANLFNSQFSQAMSGFDIVFFRNVSIYFDAAGRKLILAHLFDAMNDGGFLIAGSSETMANDLGVFKLVEEDGLFYFSKQSGAVLSRRGDAAVRQAKALPATTSSRRVKPPVKAAAASRKAPQVIVPAGGSDKAPPAHRPVPSLDLDRVRETVRFLLRKKDYETALAAIAPLETAAPGEIGPLLLHGHVRLQMHQFSEAAAIASQAAAREVWSAEAHLLLGLAAKWQGANDDAIHWFKRIVYSKPDCWPAHYYLATLFHPVEPGRARRQYATALRQITANPDPDGGLRLPLDLPVADIRFLCKHHSKGAEAPKPAEREMGHGA